MVQWIDINEYSRVKKVSISTIRRKIKSNKISFQKREGKYYLPINTDEQLDKLSMELENRLLSEKIRILTEENSELKMLVDLYEQRQVNEKYDEPPALPF